MERAVLDEAAADAPPKEGAGGLKGVIRFRGGQRVDDFVEIVGRDLGQLSLVEDFELFQQAANFIEGAGAVALAMGRQEEVCRFPEGNVRDLGGRIGLERKNSFTGILQRYRGVSAKLDPTPVLFEQESCGSATDAHAKAGKFRVPVLAFRQGTQSQIGKGFLHQVCTKGVWLVVVHGGARCAQKPTFHKDL